jgi:2Fe-2S ferredoxin
MFRIKISFEEKHSKPLIVRKAKAGQSILGICLEHGVTLLHECGGICACSTCHVYIERGEEYIEEAGQREKDMLARAHPFNKNSRLACQCVITEKKGEIDILIPSAKGGEKASNEESARPNDLHNGH